MPDDKIVTRFAPSPTGYLHVGGARTALFCWLLARHHGGRYLLRIEDTDLARSSQAAVDAQLEDLKWLGLNHDNAELMLQSRRLDVYNAIIDDLISRDLAYKAYETPQELDTMRRAAEREKRAFIYRRRKLTDDELRRYESENRPNVVRFGMPIREYRFRDEVLDKDIVLPADEAQDFVIRKADGMPTYHFGVVVDDAEMHITHVLRGQEHLKNTFYHIAIQEALAYARPMYCHLPVILNIDGSKMGKRDRDKKIRHTAHVWMKNTKQTATDLSAACGLEVARIEEWLKDDTKQLDPNEQTMVMPVVGSKESDLPEVLIHDFRANGYLPEVLLNFLALLGWSPGGDRERMSVDEMVQLFELKDIGKANAKFDRTKLLAFNTEASAATTPQRLLAAMRDFLSVNPDSPLNRANDDQLLAVLKMKSGFRTLREVEEKSRFLFVTDEQITYDPDAVEKILRKNEGQGLAILRELKDLLSGLSDWSHDPLEAAIEKYCEQKQLGLNQVAQPLRVAISGGTISPPIFDSLAFLGKTSALGRIERCLKLMI
ncbi:MAG: glutamate--tRNA ligase [Tepidisphaeraceae bacterium]